MSSTSSAAHVPFSKAEVTRAVASHAFVQTERAASSPSSSGFSRRSHHGQTQCTQTDVSKQNKLVQTGPTALSTTSMQTGVDGQFQTDSATFKSSSMQTDSCVLRSSRVQTVTPSFSSRRVQTTPMDVQEVSTQSVFTAVNSKSVQTAPTKREEKKGNSAQPSILKAHVRNMDIGEAASTQSVVSLRESRAGTKSAASRAASYARSQSAELPHTSTGQLVRPRSVKRQLSSGKPSSGKTEPGQSSPSKRAAAFVRSTSMDSTFKSTTPVSSSFRRPVTASSDASYLGPGLGPGPSAAAPDVEGLSMFSSTESEGSFYSLQQTPPEDSLAVDLALSDDDDDEGEEKVGDSFRTSSGNSSEQYVTASSINLGAPASGTGFPDNFSEIDVSREADVEMDESKNAEDQCKKGADEFGDLLQQQTFKSPMVQSAPREKNVLRQPSHLRSIPSTSKKSSTPQSSPLPVTTRPTAKAEKVTTGPYAHVKDEEWRRKLLLWPTYAHKMVSRRQEIDAIYFGHKCPGIYEYDCQSSSHDLVAESEDHSHSAGSGPSQEQGMKTQVVDAEEGKSEAASLEYVGMDREMHHPDGDSIQQEEVCIQPAGKRGVLEGDATWENLESTKTSHVCSATEQFESNDNHLADTESVESAASSCRKKDKTKKSKKKDRNPSETVDKKKKKKKREKGKKREKKDSDNDMDVESMGTPKKTEDDVKLSDKYTESDDKHSDIYSRADDEHSSKNTGSDDKHLDINTESDDKHSDKDIESYLKVSLQLKEGGTEAGSREREVLACADRALSPSGVHTENHSPADTCQPHSKFSTQPVPESATSGIPPSSAAPVSITKGLASKPDVIDVTVCDDEKGDEDPGEVSSGEISIHTDDTDDDELSPNNLRPGHSRLNLFSLRQPPKSISESVEVTPSDDEYSEEELNEDVNISVGEEILPETHSPSELLTGNTANQTVQTGSCGKMETSSEHPPLSTLPVSAVPNQNVLRAWFREVSDDQNSATVSCHPAGGKPLEDSSNEDDVNNAFNKSTHVDSGFGAAAFLTAEQKLQCWDEDTPANSLDRPTTPFGSDRLPVTPTKRTPSTALEGLVSKQTVGATRKRTAVKARLYNSPSVIWSPDKSLSNMPGLQDSMSSHSFNKFVGQASSSSGSLGDNSILNVGPSLGLIHDESARDAPSDFERGDAQSLPVAQNTGEDIQSKVSFRMRLKAADGSTAPCRSSQVVGSGGVAKSSGLRASGEDVVNKEVELGSGGEQQKQAPQKPSQTEDNTPLFGYPSLTNVHREGNRLSFQYKRTPKFLALSSSSTSTSSSATASSSSSSTSVLSSFSATSMPTEQPPPPSQLPLSSKRPAKGMETIREEASTRDSIGFDVVQSSREIGTGLSPAISPKQSSPLKLVAARIAAAEDVEQLASAECDVGNGEKCSDDQESREIKSSSSLGDENPQDPAKQSYLENDGLLAESASASAVLAESRSRKPREDLEEGEIESSDSLSKSSSNLDNPEADTPSFINTIQHSLEEGELLTTDAFPSNIDADTIGIAQPSPPQVLECAAGENAHFKDLREILQHKRRKPVNKSQSVSSELTLKSSKRNIEKAVYMPIDKISHSRNEFHVLDCPLPTQQRRKPKSDVGQYSKKGKVSDTGDNAKETSVAEMKAEIRRERKRTRQDQVRRDIISQIGPGDAPPSEDNPDPSLKSYKIPKVNKEPKARERVRLARAHYAKDRNKAPIQISGQKRRALRDSPEAFTSRRMLTSTPIPGPQAAPHTDSAASISHHRRSSASSKGSRDDNFTNLQLAARSHPGKTLASFTNALAGMDVSDDSGPEEAQRSQEEVVAPRTNSTSSISHRRRSSDSSKQSHDDNFTNLQLAARLHPEKTLAPFADALEGMAVSDDSKSKVAQGSREVVAGSDAGGESRVPDPQGSCRTRLFSYFRDPFKPRPEIEELDEEEDDDESGGDRDSQNKPDSDSCGSGDENDHDADADEEQQSSENENEGEDRNDDESDKGVSSEGEADKEGGSEVDGEHLDQPEGECRGETSKRTNEDGQQQTRPESESGEISGSDDERFNSDNDDDYDEAQKKKECKSNLGEHSGNSTKECLTSLVRHKKRTSSESRQSFSLSQTSDGKKNLRPGSVSLSDSEDESPSTRRSGNDNNSGEKLSDASAEESAVNSDCEFEDVFETTVCKTSEAASVIGGGNESSGGRGTEEPELGTSSKCFSEREIFDSSDDEEKCLSETGRKRPGQSAKPVPTRHHSALSCSSTVSQVVNFQVTKEASIDCLSLDAFAGGEGHSLLESCDALVNESGQAAEPLKSSAKSEERTKLAESKKGERKLKPNSSPLQLAAGCGKTLKPSGASASTSLCKDSETKAVNCSVHDCLCKMRTESSKKAEKDKYVKPKRSCSRCQNDGKHRSKSQDADLQKDLTNSKRRSRSRSESKSRGHGSGLRASSKETSKAKIHSPESRRKSTSSCSSKENRGLTKGRTQSPEIHDRSPDRCSKTCDHTHSRNSPPSHRCSSECEKGRKKSEDKASGRDQKTSSGPSGSCKCCHHRASSPRNRSSSPRNKTGESKSARDKHARSHLSRSRSKSQEREYKCLDSRCSKHHCPQLKSRSREREGQHSCDQRERHRRSRTRSQERERRQPVHTHTRWSVERWRSGREGENDHDRSDWSCTPNRDECLCERCRCAHSRSCDCGRSYRGKRRSRSRSPLRYNVGYFGHSDNFHRRDERQLPRTFAQQRRWRGYRRC